MQQLIDGRGEGGQGPFCRRGKRSGAIREGRYRARGNSAKDGNKKGHGQF
jgi:hypothetical protein